MSRRVLSNFGFLFGSNILAQVCRFLTITFIARSLGTEGFALYSYLLLITGYGAIAVEFGLKNFALREFSQGRGGKSVLIHIMGLRLAISVLSVGVLFLLLRFTFGTESFPPSVWMILSVVSGALNFDFVLMAAEKMGLLALSQLSQALILLLVAWFGVHGPDDFSVLSFGYFCSQMATVVLIALGLKNFSKGNVETGFSKLIVTGSPFFVASLLGLLQFSMDLFLIGFTGNTVFLGNYSAAMKLLGVALGVIYAFMGAVHPRLAQNSHDLKNPKLIEILNHSNKVVWIFLGPMILVSWMWGDSLVELAFGHKFEMAGSLLAPLSIAVMFHSLGLGPMHALSVSFKMKRYVFILFTNTLISFALVGMCIHFKQWGWIPWCAVFNQGIYCFNAWSALGRYDVLPSRELILPLVLSLVGVSLIILFSSLSTPVTLLMSGLIYLAVLAGFRIHKARWFLYFLKGSI